MGWGMRYLRFIWVSILVFVMFGYGIRFFVINSVSKILNDYIFDLMVNLLYSVVLGVVYFIGNFVFWWGLYSLFLINFVRLKFVIL